jgi:uncharacterized Zn-binding protein involved in type VI secretion
MNVCKVGDSGPGVCNLHGPTPLAVTATITTGSTTLTIDGIAVAVQGSIVVASCGHSSAMITSSPFCTNDGVGLCRVGDTYGPNPSGSITTGSITLSEI